MANVHSTAVVGPNVELASDVEVGPYVVLEGSLSFGPGCVIGPFCHFDGTVTVEERNRFISHCSVGVAPQDLKFKGEATRLEIGPGNVFREYVTLHRGTPGGGGVTRIGGYGLYMIGAHIAHDCRTGNYVIFANQGTLAGHVDIGDYATIGALSAVHQFCSVGEHAFVGGGTIATKDCLPFMRTVGSRPARCFGPNTIGLERKGFSVERRDALKAAWRILHDRRLTTTEAVERMRVELADAPDVQRLIAFIGNSKRGVILSRG